ncbi:sporulation histidine kinase inhibitor Sda [Alteribacillus sp. YIM 98480]|uniref:sporulation histidine kinase inhibitor Sda n=1 Tax=Alteribacillus sp. YIM 98480 TaxID=2606599 RepID=UPI00131A6FBD|nr:sporulation histidine kinase inhibitor Sda [Alteribacillus sp. YIM 98480]
MHYISDGVLMEAYEKAVELNLDGEFIEILHSEMMQRGLALPSSAQYDYVEAGR